MSKKSLLNIPQGVLVSVKGKVVFIKGLVGIVKKNIHPCLSIFLIRNYLIITTKLKSKALLNTFTTLILNMLKGVRVLFEKVLELKGLGFNLKKQGNLLIFKLGYSHPTNLITPNNIAINILNKDGTLFNVQGSDSQLVGEFAGKIKTLYPVEPYKGRGVRIIGQFIYKKEGKKLS
jgi:large subunit ribosomal protein L6